VGGEGEAAPLSYAVLDLENAYDWLWAHSWDRPGEGWEPETRSFEELGWPWKRPGQPPALHGCDNEKVPMYNFQGCNLWRAPNNPVEYCWRTGLLVRGEHPYALIVDDVKKDAAERAYDWYMPIPEDLKYIPLSGGRVLLAEQGREDGGRPPLGSRRLLVVPLGPGGPPEAKDEVYTASVTRGTENKARRLALSRTGSEGHFRVLLYPFRTTLEPGGDEAAWEAHPLGAAVPEIGPATDSGFALTFEQGKDEWRFAPGADGRSRPRLQRGGREYSID
jgi:hypothetical protein